jgi:glycosyltransferase involved in cell wall biosynthesis
MSDNGAECPLVSVVVPAYNSGPYISECLESIASQRGAFETEIIVVDDGSTDDTRERVRQFGSVRLFEQRNAGPSAARNRGIAESRGSLVAFLDSDDLWTEDKLAIQTAIFVRHPAVGLVFGDCLLFGDRGARPESMFAQAGLDEAFWGDPELVTDPYAKLFQINYVPTGSAVVRKDCFELAGTFDGTLRYVEDLDLWFRLARHFPVAYTVHICELKREHERNVSKNADAMALGYIDVLKKQQRLHGSEIKRRGIRLNPRIAYEYCLIGDRCEKMGRLKEARRWYLKGLLQHPSPKKGYYWLRSLFARAPAI